LQSWDDGFIVHTTLGSILARYSQNAQYPWIFTAMKGSSATYSSVIANKLSCTKGVDDTVQFIFTASGLMQASIMSGYASAFVEVSDFLAGEIFEEDVAGVLTLNYPASSDTSPQLDVLVTRVTSRYVVISYGRNKTYVETNTNPRFTYALVYDLHMRRWGKIAYAHIDVLTVPTSFEGVTELNQIGLLGIDGTVHLVTTEQVHGSTTVQHAGKLLLGGLSLVRGNQIGINTLEINNGINSPSVVVESATSGDNQNWTAFKSMPLISSNTGVATYGTRSVATYHAFKFTGAFNINFMHFKLYKAGQR
jgi:hypothetical protein